jgi:hypothetical protein
VRTRVIWETDTNDGQLIASELAFLAQDNDRNVWNLGEYPEEFDHGVFIGAPNTWIPGLADAEGRIHMLGGEPELTSWYVQGSSPSIDFLDCAKVRREHLRKICVPAGCYRDVVMIKEDTPLERDGGYQRKYYAPGVGNIQVKPVNDPEGETLDLMEIEQLSPDALTQVRQEALALDARGCQAVAVYCDAPPAERSPEGASA